MHRLDDINATGKYIYKTKGEPISVEDCTEEKDEYGLIINKDYVDKRIMMPVADPEDEKTDEANYLSMLDDKILHCSVLSCYISVKISKAGEESDATENAAEKPKEEKSITIYHDFKFFAAIGGLFIALLARHIASAEKIFGNNKL